ncbi:MAG: sulfite exporter TauE/SafE family protein [Woeseiaceae bacterium]|nr:sulfite exporter TauE/SafE family protein [Woeseiaceae bacterium]
MNPELLLPAAFAAGFFGSTHCLAMCGAVVVLLEGQGAARFPGLPRRLAYNGGRLLFYVVLGVVAGGAGNLLTAGFDAALMLLRLLAAALIIALGLTLVIDWRGLRFLESAGAGLWQLVSPLARHVLPISSPATALAAGFLRGRCRADWSTVPSPSQLRVAVRSRAVWSCWPSGWERCPRCWLRVRRRPPCIA